MAKGVEGRVWCKNKKTKVRPMTKNIFEMVILVAYKDVPSLELQRPISGDCTSVQEIEMV